jgi:plasmid maintenance system antidote protein VapI
MNIEKTRIFLDIKYNIEKRMQKLHTTKRDLSKSLGIKESSLSMKLAGKRGLTIEEGVIISKFLEISMDELFMGKKLKKNEVKEKLQDISKSILDISDKIHVLEEYRKK